MASLTRQWVRFQSTSVRPELTSLLPKKRTLNRILFDNNSRLPSKKLLPVLQAIYDNLNTPELIKLPKYVNSEDLMIFKNVLSTIRNTTNSINRNLVALENELVEQAAEIGNNDAICILAFETLGKKLQNDPTVSKEDYRYASELVSTLTEMKHPLVFKLAGDLAFKQGYHAQAADYWLEFVELEPDTILASQVYSNLGIYYFSFVSPKPQLGLARRFFEQSIRLGELDNFIVQSHYYLGQLYVQTSPLNAKYHFEISASRGLKESFPSLGFLEMNVFQNYKKSIEWFQLGVEANNDLTCMIGQFDSYLKLLDYKSAFECLTNISSIGDRIKSVKLKNKAIPKEMQQAMDQNEKILEVFFSTRKNSIDVLPSMIS